MKNPLILYTSQLEDAQTAYLITVTFRKLTNFTVKKVPVMIDRNLDPLHQLPEDSRLREMPLSSLVRFPEEGLTKEEQSALILVRQEYVNTALDITRKAHLGVFTGGRDIDPIFFRKTGERPRWL